MSRAIKPLLEHGVSTMFVDLGSTRIELLHPLGDGSPISTFLEQNPNGSIPHLCFEVRSIKEAVKCLTAKGLRILGDGIPKIGAHGKLVVFLHPKDFLGTLIELEEI